MKRFLSILYFTGLIFVSCGLDHINGDHGSTGIITFGIGIILYTIIMGAAHLGNR